MPVKRGSISWDIIVELIAYSYALSALHDGGDSRNRCNRGELMFRTILVGIRGVTLPEELRRVLWRVAGLYRSRVIVAEVRDPDVDSSLQTDSHAASAKQRGNENPLVTVVVLSGQFVQSLCDKGHEADVIVVLADDLTDVRDSRSTEMVAEIVRQAPRPIWIGRKPYQMPEHIVVAYDGSSHSCRALHLGANLAETLGARLTVLNVNESRDQVAQELVLSRAASYCEPYRMTMERVGLFGTAAATIQAFTSSHACDLLIVGAAGVGYLRGLLFGSVTGQLITSVACSVLVAK